MSDDRPIDCLHGYRKPGKCPRPKCRRPIVWVMEIGGTRPTYRPFTPDSKPFEVYERDTGVKVDRYGAEAFHRCPPKRKVSR
jgi:hypothetical protein